MCHIRWHRCCQATAERLHSPIQTGGRLRESFGRASCQVAVGKGGEKGEDDTGYVLVKREKRLPGIIVYVKAEP
jgi:hypothetical protein